MIIAMRAILITIFKDSQILPKSLLALLTDEHHLYRLCQLMSLCFSVTVRTLSSVFTLILQSKLMLEESD